MMSKEDDNKDKEKSPFGEYTVEQILASEAVTWVIQVGSDVFSVNGKFVFNKSTANLYMDKLMKEASDKLAEGTVIEKASARLTLQNLRMVPLRIH